MYFKGLRGTYSTVRQFWSTRASILTLADMIVLMACEAIEIGMNKEGCKLSLYTINVLYIMLFTFS